MMRNTILIVGGTGLLRQYLVDNFERDPKNVIVCVDLLTTANCHDQGPRYEYDARYDINSIDVEDGHELERLVLHRVPNTIINLPPPASANYSDAATASKFSLTTDRLLDAAHRAWSSDDRQAGNTRQTRFIQVSKMHSPDGTSNDRHAPEIAAERVMEHWRVAHNMPAIHLAMANIFGPFHSCAHFIPYTIERLLRKTNLRLRRETSQWLFAEDAADAIVFVSRHGRSGGRYRTDVLNAELSYFSIAEMICDQLDQLLPSSDGGYRNYIEAMPAVNWDERTQAEPHQGLRRDLGWQPLNDFHCALAATVGWHVEQGSWWQNPAAMEPATSRYAMSG